MSRGDGGAATRPTRTAAKKAITDFLRAAFDGEVPTFSMCEDGPDGWAFWITEDIPEGCEDSTSYVHADLSIEWLGTNWQPAASEPSP